MAKQTIQGPPARAPRFGLVASAEVVPNDGLRWEWDGTTWMSEHPGTGTRSGIRRVSATGGFSSAIGAGQVDRAGMQAATPFIVWGAWDDTMLGQTRETLNDLDAAARRQLEATQSLEIAKEFWLGAQAQAGSLGNHYLAEAALATGVTSAAVGVVHALAEAEDAYAAASKNARGMVHVTVQLLHHLVAANLLRREGNLWLTATDNIVVADGGYNGAGPGSSEPGASSQFLYVSPLVRIRLGAVETARIEDSIDRDVNNVVALAFRSVLLEWDGIEVVSGGSAPVFAAEVSVDPTP